MMKKSLITATLLGLGITSMPAMAQEADPAVGKLVYGMQKVEKKQVIGPVWYADEGAIRVQIGENCIGLPRDQFTEEDGQLKSPWAKGALEGTIKAGNAADFICSATADKSDPAVGKQVFAMQEVEERQVIGTIRGADSGAFRIQIGSSCIGLPRQNFTEADGNFESPWPKDALQATIDGGNPADFTCPA
jgi:hypothetical protein